MNRESIRYVANKFTTPIPNGLPNLFGSNINSKYEHQKSYPALINKMTLFVKEVFEVRVR